MSHDDHPHRHKHPHPKHKHHHHPHKMHPHKRAPRWLRRNLSPHHHPVRLAQVPRRIDPIPTERPGSWQPRTWKLFVFLCRWFPQGSNLGVYNRRFISGTKTWSRHSWGAALDWQIPGWPPSLIVLKRFLSRRRWANRFRIRTILGPDNNADHADHLHIEPECSRCTGTPPRLIQW